MDVAEVVADVVCALLVAGIAATIGVRMLPAVESIGRGPVFAAAAICALLVGLLVTPTRLLLLDAALLLAGGFVGLGLARGYVHMTGRRNVTPGSDPEQSGPATTRAAALAVSGYLWVLTALLVMMLIRWAIALIGADL